MGLAYFSILVAILIAAGFAVGFLKVAQEIWKNSRFKLLAAIPLLLAGFCAAWAVYFLVIFLREPPWKFHF